MKNIIETFYNALSNLDAEGMVECYHREIIFEDPAFGILKNEKAGNMWRMLCRSQKDKDFRVQVSEIKYGEGSGSSHLEAFYTFTKTHRRVHNIIDSKFKFKDDKIIEHTDEFDLYRWSKQALGLTGFLIGWTDLFKNKLNIQTNMMLSEFEWKLQNQG